MGDFFFLISLSQWPRLKADGTDVLKSTDAWKVLTRMIFITSLNERTSLSK